MLFENVFTLSNLPGVPDFHCFMMDDNNLVSGSRKYRRVNNPNQAMRMLHNRFLRWLRGRRIILPNATGGRKHSSPLKNVLRHERNRYFYLLDIQNAYLHVDTGRLAGVLCSFDSRLNGQEEQMRYFLAHRFTENLEDGLITGANASVDLYNHYAGVLLDRDLQALCEQYGLTFTRYVDDITISSPEPIGKRKRRAIRDLIEKNGFPLNHAKTKVCDLQKESIVICGVGLRWKGRVFLPRNYLRKLRGIMHRAVRKGDISLSVITGMMGVFWAVTNKNCMNAIERRLVTQYRKTVQILQL